MLLIRYKYNISFIIIQILLTKFAEFAKFEMSKKIKYNQENIIIKGAKLHNLKNISLKIPKNKLMVISGVSGSGKSTLAFDTLYAEGQRRYIESLSSYARQFLGKLQKPDVDEIIGLSPAIAIQQKVISKNPRSTVGTITEIYDYLKLLYARIGITYSPVSGKQVKRHQIGDVVDFIMKKKNVEEVLLLTEIKKDRKADFLNTILQQGYSRVLINQKVNKINDLVEFKSNLTQKSIYLIIDRIIIDKEDEDLKSRITDSVQTAFFEG